MTPILHIVGMVKQPAMEPSEFTMSHEDFPALPGVSASSAAAGLISAVGAGQATNTIGDTVSLTHLTIFKKLNNCLYDIESNEPSFELYFIDQ